MFLVVLVVMELLAEHGQHAARDRKAAKHVDSREHQSRKRQPEDKSVRPPDAGVNGRPDGLILWLAFAALVLTAINMFGGFAVTRRMLAMFRK